MPFQAVPDVAQIRLEGTVDGQLTINDLYFQVSGGGITPTNIEAITGACANWLADTLAPLLSENWSAQRAVGFDLGSATGPIATVGAAAPGGVASEAAPNNVAACVSIRTAQRGRSGRGRNFVPGVPGSVVTLNTLSPTFITNLLDAYDLLRGAGSFLAGWQQVVVSRQTAGALRPTGIAIPVTGFVVTTPYVRSMRSREVGHGA